MSNPYNIRTLAEVILRPVKLSSNALYVGPSPIRDPWKIRMPTSAHSEISLVDLLRVMHSAESSMRIVVNAQTAGRPIEWRISELEFARADLSDMIKTVEAAIDERCKT